MPAKSKSPGSPRIVRNLLMLFLIVITAYIAIGYQNKYKTPDSASFPKPEKRVLGYYTYWRGDYRADKIPYHKLHFISHAFLSPKADGSLAIPDQYLEPELIKKAHAAGVRVLASIGGSLGSQHFSTIAANPTLRYQFADHIETFLRTHSYDGVDIDWEFPQNAKDRDNQNLLIQTIRDKFNSSSQPAPSWILSMAIASGEWHGKWNDYQALNKAVDFYNLMTYDFHGSWSGHSGHNAPIQRGIEPQRDTDDNIEAALNYIIKKAALPIDKINLGIPFYGRQFNTEKLYDRCNKRCQTIDYDYAEILALTRNGWTEYWDNISQTPYLTKDRGRGVLTYDNPRSVQLKVLYALKQKNLGGVFVWELGTGYVADYNQPLLEALYDSYSKTVLESDTKGFAQSGSALTPPPEAQTSPHHSNRHVSQSERTLSHLVNNL